MNKLFLALLLLEFLYLSQQKTKPELGLQTDFLPTTEAFTDMKIIQTEFEKFKTKVSKNITSDYDSCVNAIQTLKCNNIDQWQSVIEELKLEISNSENIEVPFLEQKKQQKIDNLQQLLDKADKEIESIKNILEQMKNSQKEFEINSQEINIMYKLPAEEGMELIQEPINVPKELNSNVENIANKELKKAAKTYDIGDQSIQAQTTSKEMHQASYNLGKTLRSLQVSMESKQKRNLETKKKLKEDIIRLRALLNNENDIQQKNKEKIAELQGQINKCQGMPTSIEKDCLPFKLKGQKMNTELDIINARTLLLTQHLELLMKGFETEQEIQDFADKKEAEKQLQKAKQQEKDFLKDQKLPASPYKPKEQKPAMHFQEEKEEQKL